VEPENQEFESGKRFSDEIGSPFGAAQNATAPQKLREKS
jgi:hypothetical protein